MPRPNASMENVVDLVGDVGKGGSGSDRISSDAVAARSGSGDEGEVRGANEGGVNAEFNELPGAHKNGSEFQNGKALSRSGRDGGLEVEEGYFRSLFRRH